MRCAFILKVRYFLSFSFSVNLTLFFFPSSGPASSLVLEGVPYRGSSASFFPLQNGGTRRLSHQVLQRQSEKVEGPAEHDGGCGVSVPPSDPVGETQKT